MTPTTPTAAGPASFVGVRTSCCGQYARGYARPNGTAAGKCPRCGRNFTVRTSSPTRTAGSGVAGPGAKN